MASLLIVCKIIPNDLPAATLCKRLICVDVGAAVGMVHGLYFTDVPIIYCIGNFIGSLGYQWLY